jgi:hypothetical protein
LHQR